MSSHLKQQLKALPAQPGVYLFKDADGVVLYVGKASSLKHRVCSYFTASSRLPAKVRQLVARVADFELILTDSEQEAMLLESIQIKKYRPRYNVRLKDDKSYPYLKIDLAEPWPRLYVTRSTEKDGARYFGPFASAWSVRQTVALLKKLFPFRTCRKEITGTEVRPCLEFHMRRCLAPCTGAVSREEYRQVLEQVILFLEGRHEAVTQQLRRRMEEAAERLEFERAAHLRDQISAVESVLERQKIMAAEGEMDVIAFAQANDQACVQAFSIRNGKLVGREHFILQGAQDEEPAQIMTSFVKQFYQDVPNIPPLVLLQHPVQDSTLIARWLAGIRPGAVTLQVPRRGKKKELVDMVAANARQQLEQLKVKFFAQEESLGQALDGLQQALELPERPRRIECYDVSNIQGTSAVGSMVVFIQGLPSKAHYRRFRIKTVQGANDYAMLQEVLWRRFKKGSDEKWAAVPQLVLIDGGKGQLNAALEVMQQLKVAVPPAGIAKQHEEIFVPGRSEPILLPAGSPALYLVQRIRDEAHRFAIGYYQKVSRKSTLQSSLDSIEGIGLKRKRALLKKFGSVKALREASEEEIAAVPGISRSLSKRVKESL